MWNRLIFQNGANRLFEVMMHSCGPFIAKVYIAVIDAASIHLAPLIAVGNKDRRLRSPVNMCHFYQSLIRI